MAQLAATEKLLYYPTDLSEIDLFCKGLSLENQRYRLFDPCIGEGAAAERLSYCLARKKDDVGAEIVGVEIDQQRASVAKTRKYVHNILNSGIENVSFQNAPDLIFNNPPYDDNTVTGRRMELEWIELCAKIMRVNSYMILVLPVRFFKGGKNHDDLRLTLYKSGLSLVPRSTSYSEKETFGGLRFTDENYPKFKQVFLLVKKEWGKTLAEEIPVDGVVGEQKWNLVIHNKQYNNDWDWNKFENNKFDIVPGTPVDYPSVLDKKVMVDLFGDVESEIPINPLMNMRTEIVAAVIAGGMFSGVQIGHEVVRGGITIRQEVVVEEDGDDRTETSVDVMVANLSVLDLNSGEIHTFESDAPEFGERIEVVAREVQYKLEHEVPSKYVPEMLPKYADRFKDIHGPRAIQGHVNGLFEPQQHAVATILKGWEDLKTVTLIGEMGVGKTVVSIAAAVAQVRRRKVDAQKVLILLPSKDDLQSKWEEEIATSCRDIPHKIFTVKTITQAQEAFANKGLTFILIKESMAKRTSGWEHLHMKRGKCWNCGEKAKLLNSEGEIPSKENELLYCSVCGVSYHQFTRNQNGNAYASVAGYINKHYSKSYVLVVDEAHQFKGGNTARGFASQSMIRGAWHVLIMTGTLYNGYASSIFYTLYRTQGSFRETWAYGSETEFVRFYGLEKKVTKVKRRSANYSWSGYGNKVSKRVDEIPGIHPAMVASLLPYTVFMKLDDFKQSIPVQRGHTLFLDIPSDVRKEYEDGLAKLYSQAVDEMKDEENSSMALMSQFTWANAGVWDVYTSGDKVGHETWNYEFKKMREKELTQKEEAIIRLVANEKAQGYPVLLFYLQTDRRPIDARLKTQFRKYGMSLEYMPSTVNERVPFVRKAIKNGADAILCNPNLVREGIDLLEFRMIIWVGVTDDAILVNQANARNHRLGQSMETDVVYMGYNATRQSERWGVTAEKVAAMSAMHGDVRQGLAALLGEKNLIATLQDALIKYDKAASDWTLNDLPPLPAVLGEEQVETKLLEDCAPIQADEWRPKGYNLEELSNAEQLVLF